MECNCCGYVLGQKLYVKNIFQPNIEIQESFYLARKKIFTILILITFIVSLLAVLLHNYYNNSVNIPYGHNLISPFHIIDYLIKSNSYSIIYIIPVILLLISISVVVIFVTLGLINIIKILKNLKLNDDILIKIFSYFVGSFFFYLLIASSFVVNNGALIVNPFIILTIISIIISFIYKIIKDATYNKVKNKGNVLKIFSFILLITLLILFLNISIKYSSNSNYTYNAISFHAYSYLNSLYINSNIFTSLMVILPISSLDISKAWLFCITYSICSVFICILLQNLFY